MKKIIFYLTLAFISLPFFASSQDAGVKKILDNWSINVNGGISLSWGDIKQYSIYPVTNNENEWNAAYGFILSKKLSPTFELRGQFIKGNLTGTRRPSHVYFNAQYNEYNINATINFTRLFGGNDPCKRLNIYGVAGLGFIDFRAVKRTISSNKFISSRGYSAKGTVSEKMETETVVPLGLGIKYKLDSRFEVNLENIWTVANSDFIDLTKGGFKYDILSYTSIGLTYKFNFRNNPTVFADCGDYMGSRTKKGSLGQSGGFYDDPAKAEKDSLNAKLKKLEDKINQQDTKINQQDTKINQQDLKIKDLENKSKEAPVVNPATPIPPVAPTAPSEINIEALKTSIYNSIMDTLKRNPLIAVPSSGYMQFSIFYDVNKYEIKESEMKKVASIAERLKKESNLKLKIVGNADQTGSAEYNRYLSKKRAEIVYNALINKYAIAKSRLTYEGKGKDEPFSKENISVNRRVDFIKE